ncbi:MAG: WapI family immunity protein [Thermogutta sp.]
MFQFAIRGEGRDFLAVSVLGRSHPGAMDYWDGNWLQATVEVTAGGFRGSAAGDVRADELVCFHGQLVRLQDSLQGTAEFETMERWLSIRGTGDGKAHIEFCCMIRDKPGSGNTLNCTLATDQTFVRNTVTDLAEVIRAFPVVR